MFDIDKKVEFCLREWAHWCTRKEYDGVGWPSISPLVKIGQNRGDLYGGVMPEIHAVAEEIEKIVVKLSEQRKDYALALRSYYCGRGTVRVKAATLDISTTVYLRTVEKAKERITGYIESLSEQKKHALFFSLID
jgi:hypothetical protein